jgi:hypothetical protein
MQINKIHWPSLLILAILGIGAAVVLLISFGLGVNSIMGLFTKGSDPAGGMIGSIAFGFEAVILLLCSWFVLQKTIGREQAGIPFKFPFAGWQVIAVIGVVILSALLGGVTAFTEIAWLNWIILPVLTILVIVPPIWMLFGLGTNGIELGPRWRVFGILGLGMTIGPLIMIILEIVLLLGVVIAGLIIVAIQKPDLFQEIINLGQRIRGETDQQLILNLVAPYIANPAVIAAILGYIAVLVPMIEELLKPLAVWIFARKIESPAQGFAMGMLSGAAFALLESLNASGDGSANWPVIVSIRAGTSLLHMTASGLVGWGIVSAFQEKRIMRLVAAYFSAVLIHGIWNACAVGAGISTLGELIGKPEWLYTIIPAAVSGMIVLGIGMFVVLIASNRKLGSMLITHPDPQIIGDNKEGVK